MKFVSGAPALLRVFAASAYSCAYVVVPPCTPPSKIHAALQTPASATEDGIKRVYLLNEGNKDMKVCIFVLVCLCECFPASGEDDVAVEQVGDTSSYLFSSCEKNIRPKTSKYFVPRSSVCEIRTIAQHLWGPFEKDAP